MIRLFQYLSMIAFVMIFTSCEDGKSYSELLDDEERAVNWYLARNRVVTGVPADSIFIEGEDAPFYRINSDGSVYMRVINKGDMQRRPKKGDVVYFRFMRYNILNMYDGSPTAGEGNADDLNAFPSGMSFVYGNATLETTTQYGNGIQAPLKFLGYNCEVDLIVKSTEGFTAEISNCTPYLYRNMKYFKAEY